jgi:hypothetical protein
MKYIESGPEYLPQQVRAKEYSENFFTNTERGRTYHKLAWEILDERWGDVAKAPSSKGGKYHHKSENRVPFGLLNHLIRTAFVANVLVKSVHEKYNDPLMYAAFIHDVFRVGKDASYREHHKMAAEAALIHMQNYSFTWQEWEFIFVKNSLTLHMGHFPPFFTRVTHVESKHAILHFADMIASNPDVDLNCMTF